MKPKLLLRLAALLAMLAVGITANAQVWLKTNLSSPAYNGSISTNSDGTLTILAGGGDIWSTSDRGYYYYTWADGNNWEASVQIRELTNSSSFGGYTWAKAEMMVRVSDPAVGVQGSDAFIASMTAPGQGSGTAAQYRPTRAVDANNAGTASLGTKPPQYLKLIRNGSVFTVQSSTDGATYSTLQTIDTAATANGFGTPFPSLVTVGVAVTAHDDNNQATNWTGVTFDPVVHNIQWAGPTAMSIATDVQSVSTRQGSEAAFTFAASNNGTPMPALYPWTYQWYKNDAAVAGATRDAYTFLAVATDNNAKIKCVAKEMAPYDTLSITSTVATLTVTTDTQQYTGGLKLEVFANSTRQQVYDGAVPFGDGGNETANISRLPGKLRWMANLDDGGGYGDNASRRVTGWFMPWVTGDYTFYVAGDDDTDVWLSTDANPANARIICREPEWSGNRNWTNAGGGGAAAINQKNSSTYSNATGVVNPTGIHLELGQSYFIAAVLHNGTGGDNLGVTATLFADAPPQDGTASSIGGTNVALITWAPTMNWEVNTTNFFAVDGSSPIVYARAVTTGELAPHYQWYRAGASVAGATKTDMALGQVLTGPNNGEQIYCVASVPGLTITSTVAIMSVGSGVYEPGFVLNERWNGPQDRNGASSNLLGTPTFQAAIPAFEAAVNNPSVNDMANYTRKISGLFSPPANGNYTFFTCSDDQSDFYISTDATAAHKRMVAQETGWSNPWNWTTTGDGAAANLNGVLSQKSSDTWTNAASNNQPVYPNGIQLFAGTKYYIEVDAIQGGGGGNVQVTYKLTSDPNPPNGNGSLTGIPGAAWDTKLRGTVIGMNAPKCNWVNFTLQPTNPPAVAAGAGNTVNFYANGTSDSTLPVGSIQSTTIVTPTNSAYQTEVANQYVFFQWFKNGQPIAGATTTQLTLTGLRGSDNNAQIMCQMRSLGYGTPPDNRQWSNSVTATLSVTADPTVPRLVASGVYYNPNDFNYYASFTFNIPIDPVYLTNIANYTVTGQTIDNVAWVSPDYTRVLLKISFFTSPQTISVTGLSSWSGVAMTPASNVTAYELPTGMNFTDIGTGNDTAGKTDPAMPSKLVVDGTNAWTVIATGHDIWDTADGFNFLYETKTGNFDVVMRETRYGLSSPWAKVGLMAREGINGTIDDFTTVGAEGGKSRNWAVNTDPPDVAVVGGTGANQVECGYRYGNTNVATGTWFPSGANTLGYTNLFVTFRPQVPNHWTRLKREDQTLTAYAGNDGVNWWKLAQITVTSDTNNPTPLPDNLYVGIGTTGHNNDTGMTGFPDFYNVSSVDSYNSSYTGGNIIGPPGAVLTGSVQGGNVVLNWTFPGTVELQYSTDLVNWNAFAPHKTIPPYTAPATAAHVFYRIRPF